MFKALYHDKIRHKMQEKFGYPSVMQIPKLKMMSLNMGLAAALSDSKVLDSASADLTLISGQKAAITYARKSIAGFKLREGNPIGCKVTMRGDRMYGFFEKLIYIALPLERDFKGVRNRQFDGKGNCSFGVKEHIIFHEIDYDKIYKIYGINVVFVTTANSDEEARYMLSLFGLPLCD